VLFSPRGSVFFSTGCARKEGKDRCCCKVIMSSGRRKVLLKVIILGDSGCVPSLGSAALFYVALQRPEPKRVANRPRLRARVALPPARARARFSRGRLSFLGASPFWACSVAGRSRLRAARMWLTESARRR